MRPPLLKTRSMLEHSELGLLDSIICPVFGGVLCRVRCSQTMARIGPTYTLLKCVCSSEHDSETLECVALFDLAVVQVANSLNFLAGGGQAAIRVP